MDLEHFPTSEAAKRMMSYITPEWYDKSYVAKWLFQVMGVEMDDAMDICEELIDQAFPETTTWGMKYHEIKYGLPVREGMDLEKRRALVITHRDSAPPMTPWKMEQYLQGLLRCEVHVKDINEDHSIAHPNIFEVEVADTGNGVDIGLAMQTLKKIKQSHTTFVFSDVTSLGIEVHVSVSDLQTVWPITGTLPDISTGLSLTRRKIELHVGRSDLKTESPLPGERSAGESPDTNVALDLNATQIDVRTSLNDHKTGFVMPGEEDTGARPKTSTGLSASGNNLSVGVSDTSYSVQYQMCGEEDL